MTDAAPKLYAYRWVVLAVFTLVNVAMQLLWASYLAITGPAAQAMGVSDSAVGMLGMVFMIAFIPLSFPVSWAIDRYGFRSMVGASAVLMAVCGVARGLSGHAYLPVLLCSIGIAVAQPFMMNAWTTVPAKWFPSSERATAVGIVTLGSLVGVGAGMALTPELLGSMSIPSIQLAYGAVAAATAVLFLVLAREEPPTPPDAEGAAVRALVLDGLKHAIKVPSFIAYLGISFIGMGIFNGLATWIEPIFRPRGFSPDQAGDAGAVMLVGGVLGAVLLPALSDRQQNRRRYLLIGLLGAIPFLLGITYATVYWKLLTSAFLLGFFLVGIGPVGMQYAAEVTRPTPEGTSNGLIQLFGQVAVVLVYWMDSIHGDDGSFEPSLLVMAGLLVVSALLVLRLVEPAHPGAAARPGRRSIPAS
jgi:MFS family permease